MLIKGPGVPTVDIDEYNAKFLQGSQNSANQYSRHWISGSTLNESAKGERSDAKDGEKRR
jgi:hypothetical protein